MKTQPVIDTTLSSPGSIPATLGQLLALGLTPEDIARGEKRFEAETFGPWHITVSLRAPVMRADYSDGRKTRVRIYHPRKAVSCKSCGYDMEGRISLGGRKFAVFTTSALFELPDGRLIDCAMLHTANRGKLQS